MTVADATKPVFLWRCYNPKCTPEGAAVPGHDFTGTEAQCPNCGLRQDDKKHGALIVKRVVMHFETPHAIVLGGGSGQSACGKDLSKGGRHTRSPSVVTCPACLASQIHKDQLQAVETHPDYQVPVLVNMGDGTIHLDK
jgi:hypothetical protein